MDLGDANDSWKGAAEFAGIASVAGGDGGGEELVTKIARRCELKFAKAGGIGRCEGRTEIALSIGKTEIEPRVAGKELDLKIGIGRGTERAADEGDAGSERDVGDHRIILQTVWTAVAVEWIVGRDGVRQFARWLEVNGDSSISEDRISGNAVASAA